jgi:hypothetical protein
LTIGAGSKIDMRPMFPNDEDLHGIVVEVLAERRYSVRLNDGRTIVALIARFSARHDEPHYPAPGHEVTVFLDEESDEYLIVGFRS